MWPFEKHTARRKEIARSKAERVSPWYRRAPEQSAVMTALSTGATALLAALALNAGGSVMNLRENQVVSRAIPARVQFEIIDDRQTDLERLRARDLSPNYYKLDVSLLDDIRGRLTGAMSLARAHADDAEEFVRQATENNVLLDEDGRSELLRMAGLENGGGYQRIVDQAVEHLKTSLIVEPELAGARRTPREAVFQDPTRPREMRRLMTELRYSNDQAAVARVVEEAVRATPTKLRASFNLSILAMLKSETADQPFRAIYRFDTTQSVQMAEAARAGVAPVKHTYTEGDPLAKAGPLDADELELLRIEHRIYMDSEQVAMSSMVRGFGRMLLTFWIVFGVAAYMRRYQQGVFSNHLRRLASMAVLLLILGLTRLIFIGSDVTPYFAVGMQVLAAGLLAVVYADEAVFAICGALAILLSMAVQESIAFFIVLLGASAAMVFGLRVVRYRGKIVLVGLGAAATAFVASFAVGMLDGQSWRFVLSDSLWASGATLMAAFVIEGALPGVERLLGLSTGMTLLEWCDASKPLIRLLAAEAPGTYNHSLLVGALAESAADAIGANGLRCRAGAYYHDIGKINKPEYFVENQIAGMSRHDKLSPAMSQLVIVGHVKDGVEMAKEYGLPATLHCFIPEHHGTTLVRYFYHAAAKARAPDDPEVSESEFRYPGPKPQSRETALVMLCDGVEGAVRAMSEPTPNRIEGVVGDIIQKRLADGQFDECELTFRELAVIEKSLIKSLCGIYHARIVYPKEEEIKKSAP